MDGLVIKKRIGIKYCGGCNPSYERVEWTEKVKDQWAHRFIFLSHQDPEIDLLVFVNGCSRACAFMERDSTIPYYSVTQEGDFENLELFLKSYDEEGDIQ